MAQVYKHGSNQLGLVSNTMEMYCPVADSWTKIEKTMSQCRHSCGAAAMSGKIYVAGGVNDDSDPLDTMDVYDPKTQSWTKTGPPKGPPPMSACRLNCSATSIFGRLFVIGGVNEDGEVMSTMEMYDPSVNSWTKLPMRQCRQRCGVTVMEDKIWVVGGVGRGTAVLDSMEVYDPRLAMWLEVDLYKSPRRAGLVMVFWEPAPVKLIPSAATDQVQFFQQE